MPAPPQARRPAADGCATEGCETAARTSFASTPMKRGASFNPGTMRYSSNAQFAGLRAMFDVNLVQRLHVIGDE